MDFTQLWEKPVPPSVMTGSGFLAHVHFRRLINEPIRNEAHYLRSMATLLKECWKAIDYGVIVTRNDPLYERDTQLPIQPKMVCLPDTAEAPQLGSLCEDVGPEGTLAAHRIMDLCRSLGTWTLFENDLIDHMAGDCDDSDVFHTGVRQLIQREYLADSNGKYAFFLRPTFVRKLYLTCLAVPEEA